MPESVDAARCPSSRSALYNGWTDQASLESASKPPHSKEGVDVVPQTTMAGPSGLAEGGDRQLRRRRSLDPDDLRIRAVRPRREPGSNLNPRGSPPAVRPDRIGGADPAANLGGRARAYRLEALNGRTTHVVNDLLGGVPISVTYCDMTDCVRAYTDTRGTAPLGFSVGGLYVDNGPEMVLKLDGAYYFQKSGKLIEPSSGPAAIPYDLVEPTRTTWKEWVKRHPDTDAFTGDRSVERR
jgi:hypothetical protein